MVYSAVGFAERIPVVRLAFEPGAPEDARLGSGQDTHGAGVIVASGPGALVDVGGPDPRLRRRAVAARRRRSRRASGERRPQYWCRVRKPASASTRDGRRIPGDNARGRRARWAGDIGEEHRRTGPVGVERGGQLVRQGRARADQSVAAIRATPTSWPTSCALTATACVRSSPSPTPSRPPCAAVASPRWGDRYNDEARRDQGVDDEADGRSMWRRASSGASPARPTPHSRSGSRTGRAPCPRRRSGRQRARRSPSRRQ
jgi:hypothetical protein